MSYLRIRDLRVLMRLGATRAAELALNIKVMQDATAGTLDELSAEAQFARADGLSRVIAERNTLVRAMDAIDAFVENAPIAEYLKVRGRL